MQSPSEKPGSQPVFHKVGQNMYRHASSGTYYALFKRGGKQIRRSLKTSDRPLAKRRLGELENKVSRLDGTKAAGNIRFDELAKRWLDTQRIRLKAASALRLEICIKGLQPHFNLGTIRNLSARQCEDWMTRRGAKISASSYKHERRTLIAILDYAMRNGLLLDNPARTAVPTRKITKSKPSVPTREQFQLLVNTLRQADVRARPGANLVELLAYSGMRLKEGTSLTWGDIDWDRGSFTVTGGETGTKNHESRVIPLFPSMRELLERVRGDRKPAAEELVIPLAGPNGAATAIKTACKKAKLPHFLHHSLRHYFASNAIEEGIDFKVIAEWLGHKDGGFLVAQTYGHLRASHSFEMAKRMTFSARTPVAENVVALNEVATGA